MNIYLTIALSAFIATLIGGWRDQENKGPVNALVYKWARRGFFVHAAAILAFTIWFVGVATELWIWPLRLD